MKIEAFGEIKCGINKVWINKFADSRRVPTAEQCFLVVNVIKSKDMLS